MTMRRRYKILYQYNYDSIMASSLIYEFLFVSSNIDGNNIVSFIEFHHEKYLDYISNLDDGEEIYFVGCSPNLSDIGKLYLLAKNKKLNIHILDNTINAISIDEYIHDRLLDHGDDFEIDVYFEDTSIGDDSLRTTTTCVSSIAYSYILNRLSEYQLKQNYYPHIIEMVNSMYVAWSYNTFIPGLDALYYGLSFNNRNIKEIFDFWYKNHSTNIFSLSVDEAEEYKKCEVEYIDKMDALGQEYAKGITKYKRELFFNAGFDVEIRIKSIYYKARVINSPLLDPFPYQGIDEDLYYKYIIHEWFDGIKWITVILPQFGTSNDLVQNSCIELAHIFGNKLKSKYIRGNYDRAELYTDKPIFRYNQEIYIDSDFFGSTLKVKKM